MFEIVNITINPVLENVSINNESGELVCITVDEGSGGGDYLEIANNLSDLENAGTARDNLDVIQRVSASDLIDSPSISLDFDSKFFDLKRLTTTNTTITLTINNVIAGANHILSVKKDTASDVTISLVGTGLTFYGYNESDYKNTPDIVLSGDLGDIFDISFLARTATEIGIAIGEKGN